MEVYPSSKFLRHFKKLSRIVQERAAERDALFRANPFDARLDTHKLHGKQKEEWSYAVDRSYRVTFTFAPDGSVVYTNIGTHDEVYR